jgi:DNA repair and recombination RAD54-like protein
MASDQERAVSQIKLSELTALANRFIIRRTNDLLSKYLPVKYDHVVFCRLAPLQRDLYTHYIESKDVKRLLLGTKTLQPLKAITTLKKLCNHPGLLEPDEFEGFVMPSTFDRKRMQPEFSGKMMLLDRMLKTIRETSTDKIVLISNYTQTLDYFERLCQARHYGYVSVEWTVIVGFCDWMDRRRYRSVRSWWTNSMILRAKTLSFYCRPKRVDAVIL